LALVAVVAPLLQATLSFSVQLLRPAPSSFGLRRNPGARGLEARTQVWAARKKKAAAEEEEAEEKPKKKAATKKKAAAVAEEEEEEAEPAPKTTKAAAKKAVKDDRDPDDFYPGDRVSAWYHKDKAWYEAILLYKKEDGVWDVSWDEPDEGEQITSVERVKLVKRGPVGHPEIEGVPIAVGDQVLALFLEDKKWYPALLTKEPKEEGGKYTIKWDDPDGMEPTDELVRHDIKLKLRKL